MLFTNERKHRHHLVPKHLGGNDSEDNLTPPISIELHAAFHKMLWEELGHKEDYIAWKALSGRMTSEEARIAAALEGQRKSEKYKNRNLRDHLNSVRTKDTCSKGGKVASKALVEWQKQNKEKFALQCAKNAKAKTHKQLISHEYQGVVYESKKELQKQNKMCNSKFYRLLGAGEIKRLGYTHER
jgi:hypothetical protein